ncbi:hypothetical protein VPH35_094689 [Triticum aestivum]
MAAMDAACSPRGGQPWAGWKGPLVPLSALMGAVRRVGETLLWRPWMRFLSPGRAVAWGLAVFPCLRQCSYCSCSGAPFMCLCCGDAYVTTPVAHRCCGVVSAHETFRLRPTTQVVSWRWAVSVAWRFSITSTVQCLGLVY